MKSKNKQNYKRKKRQHMVPVTSNLVTNDDLRQFAQKMNIVLSALAK